MGAGVLVCAGGNGVGAGVGEGVGDLVGVLVGARVGTGVGARVGDGVGGSGRSKSSMVKFLRPPSVVGDGVGLGVIEGELALVSRGTNSANAATLMLKSEELIMELVMNIVMLSRVSAASMSSGMAHFVEV